MSWGIDVQVIDPHADPKEVEREYGIRLTSFERREPARAVVLAVAHSEFVNGGWNMILNHIHPRQGAVVTDVKGVLTRGAEPHNVTLVRA
jgi:UDP-N-acetyl-D-galactosamine dehydrogenase